MICTSLHSSRVGKEKKSGWCGPALADDPCAIVYTAADHTCTRTFVRSHTFIIINYWEVWFSDAKNWSGYSRTSLTGDAATDKV